MHAKLYKYLMFVVRRSLSKFLFPFASHPCPNNWGQLLLKDIFENIILHQTEMTIVVLLFSCRIKEPKLEGTLSPHHTSADPTGLAWWAQADACRGCKLAELLSVWTTHTYDLTGQPNTLLQTRNRDPGYFKRHRRSDAGTSTS